MKVGERSRPFVVREGPAPLPRAVGLGYHPGARMLTGGEVMRPFYQPTTEDNTFPPRPKDEDDFPLALVGALAALAAAVGLGLAVYLLGWDVRW